MSYVQPYRRSCKRTRLPEKRLELAKNRRTVKKQCESIVLGSSIEMAQSEIYRATYDEVLGSSIKRRTY